MKGKDPAHGGGAPTKQHLMDELAVLKKQMVDVDEILKRNAELEEEVERLHVELDEATNGILKRGYLFKWRDREISFASKWGLRYFVLQGHSLSYFIDDKESRPRATINLSNCCIRNEGAKKNDSYFVFSIYTTPDDASDDSFGSLLLRLSSESRAEAQLWMQMLEQACRVGRQIRRSGSIGGGISSSPAPGSAPESGAAASSAGELSRRNSTGSSGYLVGGGSDDALPSSSGEGSGRFSPQRGGKSISSLAQDSSDDVVNQPQSSSVLIRKQVSRQSLLNRQVSTDSGTNLSAIHSHNSKNSSGRSPPPPVKGSSNPRTAAHPFPASRPIHLGARSSPLSSEQRQGEQNFRGFFNLSVIIMVLAHVRMIVDEAKKRSLWDLSSTLAVPEPSRLPDTIPAGDDSASAMMGMLSGVAGCLVSILLVYGMEKIASQSNADTNVFVVINSIICLANIIVPIYWVWTTKSNSGLAMLYLFAAVILWMKLLSYAHVNYDLRKKMIAWKKLDKQNSADAAASGGKSDDNDNNAKPAAAPVFVDSSYFEVHSLQGPIISYPANLTIANIAYFMAAPTLCYQLNYPMTPSIRWKFVATYVFRLFVTGAMMIYGVERFIKPTLEHSLQVMDEKNILGVLERLLKLSIPNTYVWLLGFYWLFHLYLNLFAELTRFGDRQFYKDWWNARTLDNYWRTWNMPVHSWVLRHLYYPMVRRKIPKSTATFVSFLFSAAMHEIIISVPFRHISFHAFVGMLAQAPLIYITKKLDAYLDNSYISNAVFWVVFCVIGQPMGVILYYYDLWKVGQQALLSAAA